MELPIVCKQWFITSVSLKKKGTKGNYCIPSESDALGVVLLEDCCIWTSELLKDCFTLSQATCILELSVVSAADCSDCLSKFGNSYLLGELKEFGIPCSRRDDVAWLTASPFF